MRTRDNRLLARVPRRSGGVGLFEVPRLEELVADPDKVGVLDSYATWALRAQAIAALNLLNAQDLRLLRRDSEGAHEIRGERLLRIKEASEKFAMSRDWLYRNYKKYGLAVRCGNALCFSERAMDDFVRKQRG
jgi:predicted DNA-binding transcriptional regulator AlpA